MGPTWVLSAPDGPHVGLMNHAIRIQLHLPGNNDLGALKKKRPNGHHLSPTAQTESAPLSTQPTASSWCHDHKVLTNGVNLMASYPPNLKSFLQDKPNNIHMVKLAINRSIVMLHLSSVPSAIMSCNGNEDFIYVKTILQVKCSFTISFVCANVKDHITHLKIKYIIIIIIIKTQQSHNVSNDLSVNHNTTLCSINVFCYSKNMFHQWRPSVIW